MLKEFNYTDVKGKQTSRVVYQLSPVSDKMFAIDLSEFSEDERAYYEEALLDLQKVFNEEVRQLGLGSNYRYFKESGIVSK